MIKRIQDLKAPLADLAEVINAFKSEAVQLRIVELLLAGAPDGPSAHGTAAPSPGRRNKRRRAAPPVDGAAKADPKPARKRASTGRPGGKTVLAKLLADGFFSKKRTIGDLVAHADKNMALKLKQSAFSGGLARYVRDGKLTRSKNAENQYEYSQP